MMRRQPVDSEAVNSIGYDARQQTLAVEFREGRIYDYLGVLPRAHEGGFDRQVRLDEDQAAFQISTAVTVRDALNLRGAAL
jgi:KTSC domain